jgi:histidinol phosphatase-like enzyme (inositol monophosphatase family)
MVSEAPPADPALLEQAVALTRRAGEVTLEWFRSELLHIDQKVDGTPVTQADRAAERLIREELAIHHPTDGILGEEEGITEGTSGRRWIIDPIDGTKAFMRGVPLYSNLLALEDEHGIAIGVINIPAIRETVYAGRGLGCFCNGVPTRVSEEKDLRRSYLTTSSFSTSAWPAPALEAVRGAGLNLRTWGDGYGYVLVATGRLEAMVDHSAELYDLAPVPVIIAESGGRFTDLNGNVTPGGGHGVASNGLIHDELLALLS